MKLIFLLVMTSLGLLFSTSLRAEEGNVAAPTVTPEETETISPFENDAYIGPKILINAAARKLRLYEGSRLLKEYDIAVGSPRYPTPLGERLMKQVIWNPWWLPPDSGWAKGAKDTPPGPNNPLGPVKMDLGEAILVHGTNKPGSVGFAASHGCMRMRNEEAKELAHFIQERYTSKSDPALFAEYAKNNRTSYYVKLNDPIPVKIIYDTVELVDGRLQIYGDFYGKAAKAGKQSDLIKSELKAAGYNLAKLSEDELKEALKGKKGDFVLPIEPLMTEEVFMASATAGLPALAIIQ